MRGRLPGTSGMECHGCHKKGKPLGSVKNRFVFGEEKLDVGMNIGRGGFKLESHGIGQ